MALVPTGLCVSASLANTVHRVRMGTSCIEFEPGDCDPSISRDISILTYDLEMHFHPAAVFFKMTFYSYMVVASVTEKPGIMKD